MDNLIKQIILKINLQNPLFVIFVYDGLIDQAKYLED